MTKKKAPKPKARKRDNAPNARRKRTRTASGGGARQRDAVNSASPWPSDLPPKFVQFESIHEGPVLDARSTRIAAVECLFAAVLLYERRAIEGADEEAGTIGFVLRTLGFAAIGTSGTSGTPKNPRGLTILRGWAEKLRTKPARDGPYYIEPGVRPSWRAESLALLMEREDCRSANFLALMLRRMFPALASEPPMNADGDTLFDQWDTANAIRAAFEREFRKPSQSWDRVDCERAVLVALRAIGMPKRQRDALFKAREMAERRNVRGA